MIKTLVFDFGNVFINLDIDGAIKNALNLFKLNEFPEEMMAINSLYEQGLLSSKEFLEFYSDNFPEIEENKIIDTWNFMLIDFPEHRLEFLQNLYQTKKYKLILLSNTNEIHIDWVKKHVPFYEEFQKCFDAFYLSHEIKLRKPDTEIFDFVLSKNKINAPETLFIDDNFENITTAKKLGYKIWHINPEAEDVIDLFKIKKDLF
jgi:putative hydrolase of the HAD superfamily